MMEQHPGIPVRVGLITVMSEDNTWPDSFIAKFKANHAEAKAALQSLGFEVICHDELGRTFRQIAAQASGLRARGIEVLVLYVPDWSWSSNAVVGGINAEVPVIVWSDAHPDQNGIVGAAIIRGGLEEVGVKCRLVHGLPGEAQTMHKLQRLCIGISAATRLRNIRIGVGGSRCMGMYTAHVDPSSLMSRFGIDIDGWEQVEVLRRAEKVPEGEVAHMLKWMRAEFGRIEAKKDVMDAQIRMYLALQELIKEKQYDAVCVKCLPELPACHTTFCLAISLLNDRSDHRGPKESIVCGCEADVNGTLTMQLLKGMSGGPVMFTDVLKLDYQKNEIGMANCGSSATDFAKSRKDVFWVKEGLQEFDWKIGGACPQYVTRPGRVTLARLSRISGEYVLLITGGETVEYPREKLAEINPQHPQSWVRMDCRIETLLEELRSNHIHFVFGDYTEELEVACWALGIRPLTLRKASTP